MRSLHQKKFRDLENKFLIEGAKIVKEALDQRLPYLSEIFCTQEWYELNKELLSNKIPVNLISESELNQVSCFKSPQPVMALMDMLFLKETKPANSHLVLMLDSIQDPGNLGTIIRLAEWFGIGEIICSEDCVDCFNPKVIQATMGAILRVKISYQNIRTLLEDNKDLNKPRVYAASLDGHTIYNIPIKNPAILILGNESKGISREILDLADEKVLIPSYNKDKYNSESLNVSMAASVLCSEFMRQFTQNEKKG